MADRVQIRLELEVTRVGDSGKPLVNVFTGAAPQMPRSRAIEWQLVILDKEVLDPAVSNISSITMEVKEWEDPSESPDISKTTPTINAGLEEAQRIAQSDQHAVIHFDVGDTGLDMTGAEKRNLKKFSLIITAIRNGLRVTLGEGLMWCRDDGGVYAGDTPTAGDPTYLTAPETVALIGAPIQQINDPGVGFILVSGDGTKAIRVFLDNNGILQTPPHPVP